MERDWLNMALDVPAFFDPINLMEGAVSTFINADWRGAYARRGIPGLLLEFCASVVSYNAPAIHFRRDMGWKGIHVERLLNQYGVKIWDRHLVNSDEIGFSVKRSQVKWAEYILQRAGVPGAYHHRGIVDMLVEFICRLAR